MVQTVQRDRPADEIKITPAMSEAGTAALYASGLVPEDVRMEADTLVVDQIYRAMCAQLQRDD